MIIARFLKILSIVIFGMGASFSNDSELSNNVGKLAKVNADIIANLIDSKMEIINVFAEPIIEILSDFQKKGIVFIHMGGDDYRLLTKGVLRDLDKVFVVNSGDIPDVNKERVSFISKQLQR